MIGFSAEADDKGLIFDGSGFGTAQGQGSYDAGGRDP